MYILYYANVLTLVRFCDFLLLYFSFVRDVIVNIKKMVAKTMIIKSMKYLVIVWCITEAYRKLIINVISSTA